MLPLVFWISVLFIVYTYAGYPLLIALAARIKPAKSFAIEERKPSITLLVAAYNEEAVIAKKIENSLKLEYPSELYQIMIVADGSSDRTPDIVKQYQESGVDLMFEPERRGKMAAINRAVPMARGDVVVFSDANNMYAPDALLQLVKPFSDPDIGAATGAKQIIQDGRGLSSTEGFYWKYESWIKTNETVFSSCTSAVGEILAIRRELFIPPPGHIINDDFYLVVSLLRRGYRVAYVPTAKSYEFSSASRNDENVRRSRMTAGRYQAVSLSPDLLPWRQPILIWQILSHKYFRLLLPFGYLGALVSNILLVIWPSVDPSHSFLLLAYPYNWYILFLQLLFYFLALLGAYIHPGGLLGKILYVPTYLVNSNYAAIQGLWNFVAKRQSHLWTRVRRGNE